MWIQFISQKPALSQVSALAFIVADVAHSSWFSVSFSCVFLPNFKFHFVNCCCRRCCGCCLCCLCCLIVCLLCLLCASFLLFLYIYFISVALKAATAISCNCYSCLLLLLAADSLFRPCFGQCDVTTTTPLCRTVVAVVGTANSNFAYLFFTIPVQSQQCSNLPTKTQFKMQLRTY